jgi:hypothetical protein
LGVAPRFGRQVTAAMTSVAPAWTLEPSRACSDLH